MTNRVLAAVTGIMLALGASACRAATVEAIVDTNSDDAVGSVTFPTLTGDSDAGVVASYGGFTQVNLTTISRTLDPTARVWSRSLSMPCRVTSLVRTGARGAPTRP